VTVEPGLGEVDGGRAELPGEGAAWHNAATEGREKAAEEIRAVSAAIGIAAGAAAEAAEGRTPGVVGDGEWTEGESPFFVGPDGSAPFFDDVQVVGAVAEVERAAIVPLLM
jgi:hypothetical protein